MRALAVSIDTDRYCATVILRFIWTAGGGQDESKVMRAETFKDCVADEPTVEKANKIYDKLYRLDNMDYSAPWLFDSFCTGTGTSITGGPIPTSTRQLVVAIADDWKSTEGKLPRYSRADSLSPWRQEGESVRAMFGKNGLGWGRGLWQAPVLDPAVEPVKVEGDGRAPAGLFEIGPIYSEDTLQNARMQVIRSNDAMYCEDDPNSERYNLAAELTAGTTSTRRWRIREVLLDSSQRLSRGEGCGKLHLSASRSCRAATDSRLHGGVRRSDERIDRWLDPNAHPLLLQIPKGELRGVIELP